jgi:hypothetical protein
MRRSPGRSAGKTLAGFYTIEFFPEEGNIIMTATGTAMFSSLRETASISICPVCGKRLTVES